MIKFAHIADVHLGGWRHPELNSLNSMAFQEAIDSCIEEQVNFVLIAGDLFDLAMPSVDILKETVTQLKRLKDFDINCYIVPGSHDYSVTGKTFLDVLEKGDFCKNVSLLDNNEENITLDIFQNEKVVFAGIPGKKTGLEVDYFKKLKINELEKYKDCLKIFLLHTTLTESKPTEMMASIDIKSLPEGFDYYAAGHLHIIDIKRKDNAYVVYPGPVFPNNAEELEKLKGGSFFIVNFNENTRQFDLEQKNIRLKEILTIEINVDKLPVEQANAKILKELENKDSKDKIIILKIFGCLTSGKTSDIIFDEIREKLKESYFLIKNTSKLTTKEFEIELNREDKTIENIESEFIKQYQSQVQDEFKKFSDLIFPLIENLNFEKKEGEKNEEFNLRVFEIASKIMDLKNAN